MTKEYMNIKFSDYIRKQGDEFRKAGDGYDALGDISKACIDSAVKRFIDEYAAKKQAIAFGIWIHKTGWVQSSDNLVSDNWWYQEENDETYLTTEQLYNQFIEQQNKP